MKSEISTTITKTKINILLIEDDEDLRDSLSLYFQTRGNINLIKLENAESAFELIKQNHFDVIICDFRLPGLNGIDFFKQISFNESSIKILISAYANDDIVEDVRKIGINSLIKKPFTGEQIELSIFKYFNKI